MSTNEMLSFRTTEECFSFEPLCYTFSPIDLGQVSVSKKNEVHGYVAMRVPDLRHVESSRDLKITRAFYMLQVEHESRL